MDASRRTAGPVRFTHYAPCMFLTAPPAPPPPIVQRFVDATAMFGLGTDVIPETVARVSAVDLDGDGFADLVIDRHRVFMNRVDATSPCGRRFVEVPADTTGLDVPQSGTVAVFADLDNDGRPDAITAEFCDVGNKAEGDGAWKDHGKRTRWQRGRGDGTFEAPILLPVPPRPTIAIAVGDVDLDGWLDLWFGNTYVWYGHGVEAFTNDLLMSAARDASTKPAGDAAPDAVAAPRGGEPRWTRVALPEDAATFDEEHDLAGRPTFGTLICRLDGFVRPLLLELGYGRRWNRLWCAAADGTWVDLAPAMRVDGDAIRHGRYPPWLAERGKTDPRFAREDEKPFRSNGNNFDASVGDVDGDGRFDVLITDITHAWAGESSDRTRVLFAEGPTPAIPGFRPSVVPPPIGGGLVASSSGVTAPYAFSDVPAFSLDRIPAAGSPDEQRWNQGDLFGALADLDNDGRLDVIVSSGDYPDNQRLRVFLQGSINDPARLRDATTAIGIDHDGSQQIALADFDGDGDLDILAGQTFNRYGPDQIRGRSPHPALLRNEASGTNRSLHLRLRGDGVRVNSAAIGAIVEVTLPDGTKRVAQVVGPGGHAGKQGDFIAHVGLGAFATASEVRIRWPGRTVGAQGVVEELPPTVLHDVPAGRWTIAMDGARR
ncbi:MAG: CRTAC1 family protein [Phycisphaerales bacterium]